MKRIPDPIEEEVRIGLEASGIIFTQEGDKDHPQQALDFYLPFLDIHIECKYMHTPRISEQMSRHKSVIAIQSPEAAKLFRQILEHAAKGAIHD